MSRKHRNPPMIRNQISEKRNVPSEVDSLFDVMKDGCEFQSIIGSIPKNGEIMPDLLKAIHEIEVVRKNPCICYLANVVKPSVTGIEIDFSDDLPFNEMVTSAPQAEEIDVLIATPGGIGSQVLNFVTTLRAKYRKVNIIIPYMCMSAGTLFALSGNRIIMDSRGYIGPIDPQVPLRTGEYVPAQSILHLLKKIKEDGDEELKKGGAVPWHYVRLLDNMDHRQIGEAYTSSEFSKKIARDFLMKYKFANWITHKSTGLDVTQSEKEEAANMIADLLCSNGHWKSHSFSITRDVANTEVKLYIDEMEKIPGLERAVRRAWAMFSYAMDKAPMRKLFISSNYSLFRFSNPVAGA